MSSVLLEDEMVGSKLGLSGYLELPAQCWDFSPFLELVCDSIRQEIRPVAYDVTHEVLWAIASAGLLDVLTTDAATRHFSLEVQHLFPIVSPELILTNVPSIQESSQLIWEEGCFVLLCTEGNFTLHGFHSVTDAHSFMWKNRFSSRLATRVEMSPGMTHFCINQLSYFAHRHAKFAT